MSIINLRDSASKVKHNYRNNSYNTAGKDGKTSIQRAEDIVRVEGGDWHGGYGKIAGPGHSKNDRSVTVKPHDSNPDDVYIHCFAGDDALEIKGDLRSKGLLPQWEPNRSASNDHPKPENSHKPNTQEKPVIFNDGWLTRKGYELKATYTYFCPEGDCQCLRYERINDDKREKLFQWRHKGADGRWYSKQGDRKPTLYRLEDLRKSTTDIVWIVEGEKDADKLAERGLIAISIHKWSDEDGKLFTGRDVVILPDNDDEGRKQAEKAKGQIVGFAKSVKVLALPDLPEKGDVSDWLALGNTVEELAELAKGAERSKDENAPDLDAVQNFSGAEPDPFEYVLDPIIPLGCVTLLVSDGGVGKSMLAQVLATHVAKGKMPFGFPVKGGEVMGLFGEDPENILQIRHKALCNVHKIFHEDVKDRVHIGSMIEHDMELWFKGKPTERGKWFENYLAQHPEVNFAVIDNASDVFGDNENLRNEVRRFVKWLNGIASKNRVGILLLSHTSKSQGQAAFQAASGSTAWVNSSRSLIRLRRDDKKPNVIIFEHKKANYSQLAKPIELTFKGATLVQATGDVIDTAEQERFDREVWGALTHLLKQNHKIGMSPNAPNNPPKMLETHCRASFHAGNKQEVWDSVRRNIDAGHFVEGKHWKTKNANLMLPESDEG